MDTWFFNRRWAELARKRNYEVERRTPLNFAAVEANSTVALTAVGSPNAISLYYSRNGVSWSEYSIGAQVLLENIGDRVYFRGSNSTFSMSSSDYYNFTATGYVNAHGNVNSLYDPTCESLTIPNVAYFFSGLFHSNAYLLSAPLCPATTVRQSTFVNAFRNCTSLLYPPPELPAASLKTGCYNRMFQGASALLTAPDILATYGTLENGCRYMFEGCTSLTRAPVIRFSPNGARTGQGMFENCTSLNYVEVQFTEWPTNGTGTATWLKDVAAFGTFVCPSSLDTTIRDSSHIPVGWTVETYEPPVATLSRPALLAGALGSAMDAPATSESEDN